jgi:hypothetical protein
LAHLGDEAGIGNESKVLDERLGDVSLKQDVDLALTRIGTALSIKEDKNR